MIETALLHSIMTLFALALVSLGVKEYLGNVVTISSNGPVSQISRLGTVSTWIVRVSLVSMMLLGLIYRQVVV